MGMNQSVLQHQCVTRRGVVGRLGAAGLLGTAGSTSMAWLAACAPGAGGDSGAAAPGPSKDPVKLTLLHAWGAGGRLPLMEKMRDDFQQRNPRITVEFDIVNAQQGMASARVQKLVTTTAAGTPPDVSMIWRGEMPALALQGTLQTLDPFISRDKFNPKIYYDAEWETSRYQNRAYVLPNVSAGGWYLLYYNRAHLREAGLSPDQPPAKWPEFSTAIQRMTKVEGGSISRLGGTAQGGASGFILWALNNKGKYLAPDGRKVLFDSPETVEALEWRSTVYDPIGGSATLEAFNQQYSGFTGQRAPFTMGVQSMEIINPSRIFHVKDNNPTLEFGITVPPHGPRDSGGRSYIRGGWSYGIPSGVKFAHESWLLTHWLSATKEAAGWFMQQQLRPSPMKEVNEDRVYLEQAPTVWPQLLKAMQKDVAVPITPVDGDIDKILNQAMDNVAAKKASPRDAVRQAATDVQRELDSFWARQGK